MQMVAVDRGGAIVAVFDGQTAGTPPILGSGLGDTGSEGRYNMSGLSASIPDAVEGSKGARGVAGTVAFIKNAGASGYVDENKRSRITYVRYEKASIKQGSHIGVEGPRSLIGREDPALPEGDYSVRSFCLLNAGSHH